MKRNLFPEDIHNMSLNELELLTYELRESLIDTISKTGGHLASNLGVVEITVALHKIFDSPKDKLVWDVGHQAYVHKLITGRAEKFDTLRQFNGISGFPRVNESEHDTFNMGHSSTSISLAAGLATARDLKKENYNVVAVIGDGALTGGLAYEALNNVGELKSKVIIILNDNEMSISKNTGGMSQHLSRLRMSRAYLGIKKQVKSGLSHIPKLGKGLSAGIEHIKDSVKYAIVNGAFFEELGIKYFGPVDGHNLEDLMKILSLAKDVEQSVVIHVITRKGKGYRNAENNPNKFHSIEPFDTTTGTVLKKETSVSYSQVFGDKLLELACKDDNVVAVSAAMVEGTGLKKFKEMFPERVFDVGIAEAHAVTFSAGLAKQGLKPVVAIYSSFLQRAYDQIMSDVCMHNLPVVFAIDRAGSVGSDGETHHGIYDLSYLSHMPNLTILAPKDKSEFEQMLDYAYALESPCVVRYPRGAANSFAFAAEIRNEAGIGESIDNTIETLRSEVISVGKDIEIWAIGNMVSIALQAASIISEKGYSAGVVNARFVKPLDEVGLMDSIKRTKLIVTLEDNIVTGGFGSKVADFIATAGLEKEVKVLKLGWPEQFIEHGSVEQLFNKYGLDMKSVAERICIYFER